jgi:hypothetical protein
VVPLERSRRARANGIKNAAPAPKTKAPAPETYSARTPHGQHRQSRPSRRPTISLPSAGSNLANRIEKSAPALLTAARQTPKVEAPLRARTPASRDRARPSGRENAMPIDSAGQDLSNDTSISLIGRRMAEQRPRESTVPCPPLSAAARGEISPSLSR